MIVGIFNCSVDCVGNQTSFRRDCDYFAFKISLFLIPLCRKPDLIQKGLRPSINKIIFSPPFLVGNQTSFRRDCDLLNLFYIFLFDKVGNQTSFRRDCDPLLKFLNPNIFICRKPDLIQKGLRRISQPQNENFLPRRKPDLIQKGLRLNASSIRLLTCFSVGNQTSFRRDCDKSAMSNKVAKSVVGNQTSFRRDCDSVSSSRQYAVGCRKPDLIQKGLRQMPCLIRQ